MTSIDPDEPYSLAETSEVERRRSMLKNPHIKPLTDLRAELLNSSDEDWKVPHFDPLDGGVGARALLLLEAPGPKALNTGFISRNNPDPTARNLCLLTEEAGLDRSDSVLWNVVPWYVGDGTRIRPVNSSDLEAAAPWRTKLFECLPDLKAVLLMGRRAQRARAQIEREVDAPVFESYHPSNLALNRKPERRGQVLKSLREVAAAVR